MSGVGDTWVLSQGVQSHRGYVTRANKSVGLDPVAIDRPSGQPRLDAAMFGTLV